MLTNKQMRLLIFSILLINKLATTYKLEILPKSTSESSNSFINNYNSEFFTSTSQYIHDQWTHQYPNIHKNFTQIPSNRNYKTPMFNATFYSRNIQRFPVPEKANEVELIHYLEKWTPGDVRWYQEIYFDGFYKTIKRAEDTRLLMLMSEHHCQIFYDQVFYQYIDLCDPF